MPDQNPILLQTKLHRPPINRGLIDRPQLIEQLDRGIHHPLTLVCASAGFGKTTLVSAWLERMTAVKNSTTASLPTAWLSLDENDSDLNIFTSYVVAALRTIFPEAGEEILLLLQARQQPPPAVLYATLSNEIEQLSESFILVLDDYHTVHGVGVHGLLIELARHWPKPLHLVLISRINPPLQLTDLRAKGKISEIRTHDLRFTPEETAAYLSQAQLATLSKPVLHFLEERFEGWIAGLHLAALSLRSLGSQEALMAGLSGENPNIAGYLVDEVLTHQPAAIQTFLVKSSILDRFCVSLCEAVMEEVDPAWNVGACLNWIELSELFITPLDNRREWYRYHHLFQELLHKRLSTELASDAITNLHRLASAWFETHGLLDEALQHALAAGDLDLAARQMNAGLCNVLNCEDRPTLERWLRMLPEEMIQRSPRLLMIRVWALQFSFRLPLQAQALQQVEELLEANSLEANSLEANSLEANERQILHGQIFTVRTQQAYFNNQTTSAIDLCRQALALLPSTWTFVRGGAMLYLGMSMQANGQVQEAERLLLEEYESCGDKTDSYALFLLLSLCFIYLQTGQLEQTRRIAQVLLKWATHSRIAIMKNWGDWFLGLVCYQRGDLEAAAKHFTQIIENRFTAQISTYRDAVAGLALIHAFKGEKSEARQMVESISQFDLEQSGNEDSRTRSLRARLQLIQGDLESAGRWVDAFSDLPPDQPLLWLEEPQVTRARVLVERGSEADLRLALQILDVLDKIIARTHNTRYQIELLALRALARDAVALRAEGETSAVLAQPSHRPAPCSSDLVEPLSTRELEVLTLLREPLSIKEIARKLNISYATTKRHTINIYGKLGVNTRWDAVARGEELRLLPPR